MNPVKTLKLHSQPTEQELYHAYRHAPTPQVAQRFHALSLLRRSTSIRQVAALLGVSRSTLTRWCHWYATEGTEALVQRTHGGARRTATSLTPEEQVAVRDYAATHGFRTQAVDEGPSAGVVSAVGLTAQASAPACRARRC